MSITIQEARVKHSSETRNVGVSLSGCLESGETITGTPTVTAAPSGLTISGQSVNAAIVEIEGVNVPIGEAVLFAVAGGTDATKYTITVTAVTSEGQTIVRKCVLRVCDN